MNKMCTVLLPDEISCTQNSVLYNYELFVLYWLPELSVSSPCQTPSTTLYFILDVNTGGKVGGFFIVKVSTIELGLTGGILIYLFPFHIFRLLALFRLEAVETSQTEVQQLYPLKFSLRLHRLGLKECILEENNVLSLEFRGIRTCPLNEVFFSRFIEHHY